jgi:hypothetical protein
MLQHALGPALDRPAPPLAMHEARFDENGFVDWLVRAEAGEAIAYYRGHLVYDRYPSAEIHSREARADLEALADRVMAAAEQGLVHPVQKRIGAGDFLYIAVRSSGRVRIASRGGAS